MKLTPAKASRCHVAHIRLQLSPTRSDPHQMGCTHSAHATPYLSCDIPWSTGVNATAQPVILHASQVPLWAEYRLAVTLQPVSNAVVLDAASAADGAQTVALHVFGVAQGTCPPGTYLKPRPGCAVVSVWCYSCCRYSNCPWHAGRTCDEISAECL